MLRDWGTRDQSQQDCSEFPSREQNDPPADSGNVLREWSVSAAPEVQDEDEEVHHELDQDPMESSAVSGLSMPVFTDDAAVSNPFDDQVSTNMNTFAESCNVESEQIQMIRTNAEVMNTASENVDVEACHSMRPCAEYVVKEPSNGDTASSRSAHIKQKLNDIWHNPAAKFKLMIGASVIIVIICVIAIAGSSSGNKSSNDNGATIPTKGSGFISTVGGAAPEPKPTDSTTQPSSTYDIGTIQVASSRLTELPTFSPTAIPTYALETPPTDLPTSFETTSPSNLPSLSPVTPSPTAEPITLSPTMDCSDSKGLFLTYNDKLRDCDWLDNGYNGAKSDRKDMNCLSSDLGGKCRYTCRLYNGCMNDLLSRVDIFSSGSDISIGNACIDKEGTFMGNNHIPRNCSWIEEDPYTAPMKKNLNCGTPVEPRTELGAMCPGSCAGYNECGRDGSAFSANDKSDDDSTAYDDDDSNKDDGKMDDDIADDDDDGADDGLVPTLSPTFDATDNETASDMINYHENATCTDEDGEFQTHLGPAHFRQCRWFNRDGDGLTIEDKVRLNCHKTEIGKHCLSTCGCMDDRVAPTLFPTMISSSEVPTYLELSTVLPTIETCDDADGEFQTHVGPAHFRQCRWFNRDGDGLTIADKKRLNCHITEIGMNCLGHCGCIGSSSTSSWETEVKPSIDKCNDVSGLFETHESSFEACDWLDESDERKKLNCGVTELGNACICRCPPSGHKQNVLIQDVSWDFTETNWDYSKVTPRPSKAPTKPPKKYEGRYDETGKYLVLEPTADATVAQADADESCGDSLVLRVAPSSNKMQTLIQFDLSHASELLGSTFGNANLRLYATGGSTSGGLTFKQMDGANWNESKITWNSLPGGEGEDELILSFLYNIEADTWYEIDVTPAVRDALDRRKQYLSIRITSEETEVTFASKEREDVQPQLVIDTDTAAPTLKPTFAPSPSPSMSPAEPTTTPTMSPVIPLDCFDHKGKFRTISGEKQSCSWFDVGEGALKKEQNCNGEAKMFCQAQCSEYNGCDDMTCEDRAGAYTTHSGWTAECSWLLSGQGALKLEMNCGTNEYPITELGKRCQATCGAYNGCNSGASDLASDLLFNASASSEASPAMSFKSDFVDAMPQEMSGPISKIIETPTTSPVVSFDCIDRQGTFKTNTGASQTCSWLNVGNGAVKKELNCQGNREARLFCQSSCGEYNGCDEMTCEDHPGSYITDSGWSAECSWLLTEESSLKLERNCGTDGYPITEIGKRCQATCGDYNGCNSEEQRFNNK